MNPSPALDIKAFVPAKDFELSKQFYADLASPSTGAAPVLPNYSSVLSASFYRSFMSSSTQEISG
jgi:hypothetical protein